LTGFRFEEITSSEAIRRLIDGLPRRSEARNGQEGLMSGQPERRAHPRFAMDHLVTIHALAEVPVPGTMVNLSLGGAAIRVHDWNAAWLNRLEQSDELWLSGLLEEPISCRVVVTDGGTLRVHFEDDAVLRRKLQEIVGRLTSE